MKNEPEQKNNLVAIGALAIFYFVFLGGEYLFDNMIAHYLSSAKVVVAQSGILGISGIGFLCYFQIQRFISSKNRGGALMGAVALGIVCIFMVQQHVSFAGTLSTGLILFLLLGILGGGVHLMAAELWMESRKLARYVGTAYGAGILMQFINNNLVRQELVEAVILSVLLTVLAWMLSRKKESVDEEQCEASRLRAEVLKHPKNPQKAAMLLVILVALMTCIFATLDNAVTMAHAKGTMDIGQWPRLLLACSGLAAGWIFDLGKRKYMSIIMYCVMLLSTVCVVMIQFGGPFLVGLVVFYLSAGFFAVYFTTGFLALSMKMKRPALWAGMGRGVNNLCALMTGTFSVLLLDTGNNLLIMTLSLVLFAVISVVLYLYLGQYETTNVQIVSAEPENVLQEEEIMQKFCERFVLTQREGEVLEAILHSEENAQKIAEELNLSRAALYRHISSINEKTGTGSRIGLIQFYFSWEKEHRLG